MKVRKGDLIQLALRKEFDLIIHGCNCYCTMGAGIAKTIRDTFPEAYEVDCNTVRGDKEKLGTISHATLSVEDHELVVVNAYTQFNWHGSGVLVDYLAVEQCMRAVRTLFATKKIGYPRIGAGLAGGDWPTIAKIIDEQLAGVDHTLVEYCSSIE